jgi:hypothetical protein
MASDHPIIRTTRICSAIAAVFTAGALAACGGASDNGVASKSPASILATSQRRNHLAKSVHVAGTLVQGGPPIPLALDLVAGKGATGQIASQGKSVKLIVLGRTVYMNGGAKFWPSIGGLAAAHLFAGRWVKVPRSRMGDSLG